MIITLFPSPSHAGCDIYTLLIICDFTFMSCLCLSPAFMLEAKGDNVEPWKKRQPPIFENTQTLGREMRFHLIFFFFFFPEGRAGRSPLGVSAAPAGSGCCHRGCAVRVPCPLSLVPGGRGTALSLSLSRVSAVSRCGGAVAVSRGWLWLRTPGPLSPSPGSRVLPGRAALRTDLPVHRGGISHAQISVHADFSCPI